MPGIISAQGRRYRPTRGGILTGTQAGRTTTLRSLDVFRWSFSAVLAALSVALFVGLSMPPGMDARRATIALGAVALAVLAALIEEHLARWGGRRARERADATAKLRTTA